MYRKVVALACALKISTPSSLPQQELPDEQDPLYCRGLAVALSNRCNDINVAISIYQLTADCQALPTYHATPSQP